MKRVLLTEREYRALTKIRHGVSHFNNHLNESVSGEIDLTEDEKKELKKLRHGDKDYTAASFIILPKDFVEKFGLTGVVDTEFDESSKIYLEDMPSKDTLFKIYKAIFKYNLAFSYFYADDDNEYYQNKKLVDPGTFGKSSEVDHMIFTIFTISGDEVKGYKFFNGFCERNPLDL